MIKPLDLCIKFNEKINEAILTQILECTEELYTYGLEHSEFEWDNESDNGSTLFDIDFYDCGSGVEKPFVDMTNIVITIKNKQLQEDFQFKVIDIFNDRVEVCDEVNGTSRLTIPLTKLTDIDEGYIFQLETESPVMPFTVEQLKLIQKFSSNLDKDY